MRKRKWLDNDSGEIFNYGCNAAYGDKETLATIVRGVATDAVQKTAMSILPSTFASLPEQSIDEERRCI